MLRLTSLLRGLLAALALTALVVGIPVGLITLVGWPLPTTLPEWEQVRAAITDGAIDDSTLVKVLAVALWVIWAQLTVSLIADLGALLRGRVAARVPTLPPLRRLTAELVTTAALLFSAIQRPVGAAEPQLAVATAIDEPRDPPTSGPASLLPDELPPLESLSGAADDTPQAAEDEGRVWRVERGDTLWGIAEQTLGEGLRWREIHALNVGRPQPGGGALQPGSDLIRPGWRLVLPDETASSGQGAAEEVDTEAGNPDERGAPGEDAEDEIVVERGDTLWELADEHLDDPYQWPALYRANAGDPQPDGRQLQDPDLILPGWHLELPSTPSGNGHEPADEEPAGNEPAAREGHQGSGAPPTEPAEEGPPHSIDARGGGEDPGELDDTPEGDGVVGEAGLGDVDPTPTPGPPAEWDPGPGEQPAASADEDVQGEPVEEESEPAAPESSGLWGNLLRIAAIGMLATGLVATLDRLRAARLRRRRPGQRLALPSGELETTERRLRANAAPETATLIDHGLRVLSTQLAADGRALPETVLVEVTNTELVLHLAAPDIDAPGEWEVRDEGATWALPRTYDLDELAPEGHLTVAPVPTLVSLGTAAEDGRQVLFNLAHARLLSIEGPEEQVRRVQLSLALDLATSARADAVQVLVAGLGGAFATLERLQFTDTLADCLAQLEPTGPKQPDPTVVIAPGSPDSATAQRLQALVGPPHSTIAAVTGDVSGARWRLTLDGEQAHLAPSDLTVQLPELDDDTAQQVSELLVQANRPPTTAESEADGQATDTPAIEIRGPVEPTDSGEVEVRVLGTVDIRGIGDWRPPKAIELICCLAVHPDGLDMDAINEYLWPGQPPSSGRVHKVASRARTILGTDPDSGYYLPDATSSGYRLSDRVQVDYARFHAHQQRGQQDTEVMVEEYAAALALVRGRPFAATATEYTWATELAYHIQWEIGEIAHLLAIAYLKDAQPANARWAAEQGLLADATIEVLYRDLMAAAAAEGDTARIRATMDRVASR